MHLLGNYYRILVIGFSEKNSIDELHDKKQNKSWRWCNSRTVQFQLCHTSPGPTCPRKKILMSHVTEMIGRCSRQPSPLFFVLYCPAHTHNPVVKNSTWDRVSGTRNGAVEKKKKYVEATSLNFVVPSWTPQGPVFVRDFLGPLSVHSGFLNLPPPTPLQLPHSQPWSPIIRFSDYPLGSSHRNRRHRNVSRKTRWPLVAEGATFALSVLIYDDTFMQPFALTPNRSRPGSSFLPSWNCGCLMPRISSHNSEARWPGGVWNVLAMLTEPHAGLSEYIILLATSAAINIWQHPAELCRSHVKMPNFACLLKGITALWPAPISEIWCFMVTALWARPTP